MIRTRYASCIKTSNLTQTCLRVILNTLAVEGWASRTGEAHLTDRYTSENTCAKRKRRWKPCSCWSPVAASWVLTQAGEAGAAPVSAAQGAPRKLVQTKLLIHKKDQLWQNLGSKGSPERTVKSMKEKGKSVINRWAGGAGVSNKALNEVPPSRLRLT